LHELSGEGQHVQDIDALHELTAQESPAGRFAQRLGKMPSEATPKEVEQMRPRVQADMVRDAPGPVYIKTNKAIATVDNSSDRTPRK
jgi:hypothetical protein